MKWLLLLTVCALSAYQVNADVLQPINQRDWTFPVGPNSLIIRLSSVPSTMDGKPIYTLQIIAGSATPSVAEEAGFLETVTMAMQGQDMPPTRIVAINLELREPDVSKRLSMAAYESNEWRTSKPTDSGVVVARLLNSIGAYDPFNKVFDQYGLEVKVSHAEYISTVKPEQMGLKRNGVSRLPSGATLEMVLLPKSHRE